MIPRYVIRETGKMKFSFTEIGNTIEVDWGGWKWSVSGQTCAVWNAY